MYEIFINLCNKYHSIINKMCFLKDQVIIPLSTTGLKSKQKSSDQEVEDDPLLVVHPNYVVDT